MAGNNVWSGVLAVILGILIMAFPLFSILTLNILTVLALVLIGIWLMVMGFQSWSESKGISIAAIIVGIIGVIVGLALFGKVLAFSILVGLAIYIGGLFLIIAGIVSLITGKGAGGRWGGVLGIIFGILYMIIGIYAFNPLYLAWLIGLFLILSGIFQVFMPAEVAE